eukprot:549593_1
MTHLLVEKDLFMKYLMCLKMIAILLDLLCEKREGNTGLIYCVQNEHELEKGTCLMDLLLNHSSLTDDDIKQLLTYENNTGESVFYSACGNNVDNALAILQYVSETKKDTNLLKKILFQINTTLNETCVQCAAKQKNGKLLANILRCINDNLLTYD